MAALSAANELGDDRRGADKVALAWLNQARQLGIRGTVQSEAHKDLQIQEHLRGTYSALQWAKCGFPQVVMPDRLVASLMARKMPRECVPHIDMPWDTWIIRIPKGLLWCRDYDLGDDASGEYEFIKSDVSIIEAWVFNDWMGRLVMSTREGVPAKTIYGCADDFTFGGVRRGAHDWAELAEELGDDDIDPSFLGGKEAIDMLGRLVLGTVAELNNAGVTRASVQRERAPRKLEKRGLPRSWTFTLKANVKVDVRDWVRRASASHTAKERKSPTVQVLVRGHWKPKLSERIGRLVAVEPYWRGPEDAPIAVRSHVLRGSP